MSDRNPKFAEQMLFVRPTTLGLVMRMLTDAWPGHAAVVDFGIDSPKHYEALYFPIREAEIMPSDLDAALGDGPKLTALAREAASNSHKDVEFHTSWDLILGRDSSRTAKKIGLEDLVNDKAETRTSVREVAQEKEHGGLER